MTLTDKQPQIFNTIQQAYINNYNLDTINLLTTYGWILHPLSLEPKSKPVWLGRLFKGLIAELHQANSQWVVNIQNYSFKYKHPPKVKQLVCRLAQEGLLIETLSLYNLEETTAAKLKGWVLYGPQKNQVGNTVPLFVQEILPCSAAFLHWTGYNWQVNWRNHRLLYKEIPTANEVKQGYSEANNKF